MLLNKISGLVAAPFTPFKPNGKINPARIPLLARHLQQNKVAGAFICGTTGEGSSMTTLERCTIAEAWADCKPRTLALIVHVGHNSLSESIQLARHAASIGADAFAMLSPCAPRPVSIYELVESCALVAKAAPHMPFYYYHMPAVTGVNFAMIDFLKIAASRIPNLAGIKFTHENLMDFTEALNFLPKRYDVFFGRDEILLAALSLGATAAVGSTYNYAAPIYQRLIKAFRAGDLTTARVEQSFAVQMIKILLSNGGGLEAGKEIMRLIGLDCGEVRLPMRPLDASAKIRLKTNLEKLGFFEAIQR